MSNLEHYFENLLFHGQDVNGDWNKNTLSEAEQEAVRICADYVLYTIFLNRDDFLKFVNGDTNADLIRRMSNEEMANFIERTKFNVCKQIAEVCGIYNLEEHWYKDDIVKEELEWLNTSSVKTH